jgi:hypothetical protein
VSFLVWEGIRDASRRQLVFDSDGLNSSFFQNPEARGGILFFAGFGGQVRPRYIVTKSNFQGKALSALRHFGIY